MRTIIYPLRVLVALVGGQLPLFTVIRTCAANYLLASKAYLRYNARQALLVHSFGFDCLFICDAPLGSLMLFFVYGSIVWFPRRRGTTPSTEFVG